MRVGAQVWYDRCQATLVSNGPRFFGPVLIGEPSFARQLLVKERTDEILQGRLPHKASPAVRLAGGGACPTLYSHPDSQPPVRAAQRGGGAGARAMGGARAPPALQLEAIEECDAEPTAKPSEAHPSDCRLPEPAPLPPPAPGSAAAAASSAAAASGAADAASSAAADTPPHSADAPSAATPVAPASECKTAGGAPASAAASSSSAAASSAASSSSSAAALSCLGLQWRCVRTRPTHGRELKNPRLAFALRNTARFVPRDLEVS